MIATVTEAPYETLSRFRKVLKNWSSGCSARCRPGGAKIATTRMTVVQTAARPFRGASHKATADLSLSAGGLKAEYLSGAAGRAPRSGCGGARQPTWVRDGDQRNPTRARSSVTTRWRLPSPTMPSGFPARCGRMSPANTAWLSARSGAAAIFIDGKLLADSACLRRAGGSVRVHRLERGWHSLAVIYYLHGRRPACASRATAQRQPAGGSGSRISCELPSPG